MFIYNVNLNNNWLKKILIVGIILILVLVFFIVGCKFYNSISSFTVSDNVDTSHIDVNSNNYTDILKDSHENIDNYIGKKIKFTGFVYRLYDFDSTQFVLAREMIISSNNQAVIVGFLSTSENASSFKAGTWVEVEGTIEKGNYHGNIPVIKVEKMCETSAPNDEFVFPPSNSFINDNV